MLDYKKYMCGDQGVSVVRCYVAARIFAEREQIHSSKAPCTPYDAND